jgi:type VI secretion system secreted protein Hcp
MLFLWIDGVTGNCTETDYVGYIKVDSFSIGMGASLTSVTNNAERTHGSVQISEMGFSKEMDVASLALASACAGNVVYPNAYLYVTRTLGDKQMMLVEYHMTDVLVSGISTSGSGHTGLPQENFSLNFTAITAQYTKQTAEATIEGQSVFGWDMKSGAVKAPA